jgi:L-alanine-DL-glutamate epimerase-like enolase superfamily enzyme
MPDTIERIEMATLTGTRPRPAGSNARLGVHGDAVRLPVVRLVTSDGAAGFGRSAASEERLNALLGQHIEDLVVDGAVVPEWRDAEFPLLDLAARIANLPVHALLGREPGVPLRVRAYDTSLYFDDLHLADDAAAADLIAAEAMEGFARGHRAFKIKVGRGARHMPLEEGTRRDVAVIRAVRDAAGLDATVMIDANNGWNLNLTKRVLAETADANVYWIEEAFHEDNVLYEDLRGWMSREGLPTLIADGEGAAHPHLVRWATEGIIDLVQYDMVAYGFGAWRDLGAELDATRVASAPHTYGNGLGHFATAQLSGVVAGLEWVEWDEAAFAVIDASGYVLRDGWVTVPDTPGFGRELDEAAFAHAMTERGFTLTG